MNKEIFIIDDVLTEEETEYILMESDEMEERMYIAAELDGVKAVKATYKVGNEIKEGYFCFEERTERFFELYNQPLKNATIIDYEFIE